jgi:hypothetical protein
VDAAGGRPKGGDVNEAVFQTVATSGVVAIAAGMKKFPDMFRHARYRVEVEGEDQTEGNHAEPGIRRLPGRLIVCGYSSAARSRSRSPAGITA